MVATRLTIWAPVVVWAGVIFTLSSVPILDRGLGSGDLGPRDLAHFAEYAILGALLLRALRREPLAALLGSAYAATDEVHQTFVTGRQGSPLDWTIDTAGVVLGVLLFAGGSTLPRTSRGIAGYSPHASRTVIELESSSPEETERIAAAHASRTVIELVSSSPEETERIAAALARELRPGDVVMVAGELGSGKTTFVRGACRALGITAAVTSPTYTIGHRYAGEPDVSHLDLHRFVGISHTEWGDLERYFEDAVVFVEWPEAAEGWLPQPRARVRLRHLRTRHRLVRLESPEKALEIGLSALDRPRV